MNQLHPKAVWLFFFNFLFVGVFVFLPIAFFLTNITYVFSGIDSPVSFFTTLISNMFVVLILWVVLVYVWARLYYNSYKYILENESFKKESGVLWKKYTSIPYERIQNVDIYRGPLARMLGLSDLQIQTAGMSATVGKYGIAGGGSEGRLPGVAKDEAERIREELIKRIKHNKKDQGL